MKPRSGAAHLREDEMRRHGGLARRWGPMRTGRCLKKMPKAEVGARFACAGQTLPAPSYQAHHRRDHPEGRDAATAARVPSNARDKRRAGVGNGPVRFILRARICRSHWLPADCCCSCPSRFSPFVIVPVFGCSAPISTARSPYEHSRDPFWFGVSGRLGIVIALCRCKVGGATRVSPGSSSSGNAKIKEHAL
ncbi:hypothetical protein L1887_50339 [Cichorium endivia]|nr:hypothetical protein L1887_50339 [Cichorium endivia]